MTIDKKLNLDTPLELMQSGTLCHAMNIKLSDDGTTIQNENGLDNIFTIPTEDNCKIVGFISTNKEIVLFADNNIIYRIDIQTYNLIEKINNIWNWEQGEVFGTYTYNVKNNLILAISERNTNNKVPLKIINLDDKTTNNNINKIFPPVPIGNFSDVSLISGKNCQIGTYVFFIRYSIDDINVTNWFPIGIPIYLFDYDNLTTKKNIIYHTIQSSESRLLNSIYTKYIKDYYNEDKDTCNKNINLNINFYNLNSFNKFELAYIHTYNGKSNAYIYNKYDLKENLNILFDGGGELYNIDDLTINTINIFNIKTLCNYKNRLYVADFEEDNKNKYIKNINTDSIKVKYDSAINELYFSNNINSIINIEKVFAPCTFVQFYLHYVFFDGTYSDGILIKGPNNGFAETPNYELDLKTNELKRIKNDNNETVYIIPANKINNIYFSDIPVLNEAIGYFISYTELENTYIGESVLSGNDEYTIYDYINKDKTYEGNIVKCYYDEFNSVGGNATPNKLIKVNKLINASSRGLIEPTTNTYDSIKQNIKIYNITKIDIISPDTFNNQGKEGYLQLTLNENIIIDNNLYTYILINDSNIKNKYMNKDKTLISLGYISNRYSTYMHSRLNFPHYKTNSSIYYYYTGIIINNNDSVPLDYEGKKIDISIIENYNKNYIYNIIYPTVSLYPLFTKTLNIAPEEIYYNYNRYKYNDGSTTQEGHEIDYTYQKRNLIVRPININSLFKVDEGFYSYIQKIYQEYDINKINLTSRTICRSDVISDESLELSWKYFRAENYKIISENKGDIKNVVAAGTYLLVHCENSLFAFDVNNVMQTADKDVQLTMPDIFNVSYKEVFTAENGFGGLQDNTSWIFNEYGYIFLDNNSKTIYKFDNGNLDILNKNINRLLKNNLSDYNYHSVRIGFDKVRNRLIFFFVCDNEENNFTLSYNILINDWISTHSYNHIKYCINTKDKLFYLSDIDNTEYIKTYIDNYNDYKDATLDNLFYHNDNESYIDIVFTANYNYIKVLNYITYIIDKEPNYIFDKLALKIYSDTCITKEIDLSTERKTIKEYNKPYFDYNKWNLNYFRNIAKVIHNKELVDRLTGKENEYEQLIKRGYDNALVVGKYFVIRFIFKYTTKEINIKDIQAYYK